MFITAAIALGNRTQALLLEAEMADTTEPTGIGYELSHLTVEEASLIENLLDSVIKELFREAQRSGVTVAGLHIKRYSGGASGETVRIVVIPAGEEP